jgi:DMSO/TMAO reductase YedYZ heme-binding membrane subunit
MSEGLSTAQAQPFSEGADSVRYSSELPPERTAGAQRRWLISGVCVAAAGAASTTVLYLLIAHQQSQGASAAALAMSDMHMQDMHRFWSFPLLQASGLTGLLFAYLAVVLGLQQSARALPGLPLTYRQIDRLHRQVSLLVIGLVVIHVVATVLDGMGDSMLTVLVPWQWAYQGWPAAVWGYTFGIVAMYVMFLVAPTFSARRWVGTARWRFLHRFVLVFYGLSVGHALILGLDVGHYPWIRPVIWLAQVPLLALLIRRLLAPMRGTRRLSPGRHAMLRGLRYGLTVLSGLAIIAFVAIVVSGHSDLIATI